MGYATACSRRRSNRSGRSHAPSCPSALSYYLTYSLTYPTADLRYALWSLSLVTDAISRRTIVKEGCIQLLIDCLRRGQLSLAAQEHAAAVLTLLARELTNCTEIVTSGGIAPLVRLYVGGRVSVREIVCHLGCLVKLYARQAALTFTRASTPLVLADHPPWPAPPCDEASAWRKLLPTQTLP